MDKLSKGGLEKMEAGRRIRGTIPTYTKVGIRVTVVLMILIAGALFKNCASSIYYGTITERAEIDQYFRLGFREGAEQARRGGSATVLEHENPLLVKSYQRGFRDGWDSVRGADGRKP